MIAYHLHNVTAEGLVSSKLARILTDAGMAVTAVTSDRNWLEGEVVQPAEGPLAGITIHRVAPQVERLPRWWRRLAAGAGRGLLRDKLAAVPALVYGCSPEERAWVTPAVERTVELWETGGFDLLHSRLNPPAGHLAALAACRRLGDVPWCAYFSDPWPPHRYPPPYRSTIGPLQRRRLDALLDRILARADALIFPAAALRDHLLAGRRRRWRAKTTVAPHLRNVWQEPRPLPGGDRLNLRHAGFLMKERRLEPLFDAIRRLRRQRPELAAALRLELAGRYPGSARPAPPADLETCVAFHPFRRLEETWEWLMGAHVLLLVEADMERGIFFPSKLAEYLGAARPILALSPARGVAAELLAGGGGLVAPPADAAAIAAALERLLEAWRKGRLDAFLPTAEQVRAVSPAPVAARYRAAFAAAVAGRRGD